MEEEIKKINEEELELTHRSKVSKEFLLQRKAECEAMLKRAEELLKKFERS